ncbi:MAG: ABC transporter substrate-binding protein [Desulfovibrionaceae bacterium]
MKARILLLALVYVFTCLPASAAEPIKIGGVFSVTGPASFLGEPEKNTVEMLAEQINAAGGVLGRKLEVIVYDDETDVNKCVLASRKLLMKDRVAAVLGPSTSGNTLAIMKFFSAAKTPLVSCAASEKIVNPVNPWVFKTPQSDRHAVTRILLDCKERGYKRIAILTVSNGFGQSGRAVLQELVPAMGMTLAADEVYGPKDTDMTAQLTKIRQDKPDAIICWGTNPGPAVVARNRVQLGIDTPLYMSHGVASKKFIELAGDAAEGIRLPAGRLTVANKIPDDNPQKPVLLDYIKDYEAEYDTTVSTFGGYGYDALMLTVTAIRMGKSAKPQDIRDNLEKITGFVGVSGVFDYSPSDHNGLSEDSFVMVVIENGDWKLAD